MIRTEEEPAEGSLGGDGSEESESGQVAPPARPRRRTALLIAGAAVLGIVAGTCTGYLVQADREPTELPSLSQPALAQAKGEGPEPLSAAQDRQVKTEGDLRKLLVKRPKGARDGFYTVGQDGWISMDEYAETFKKPAGAFEGLVAKQFRRAVGTTWRVGSTYSVEVRLVQYRQEETAAAADAASGQYYWAGAKANTDSWPVPGTGDGMAYVHRSPEREPGYLDLYNAQAVAWRGDLVMEIWITDTKQIPKKDIVDLAKRQMERL